MPPPPSEHAGCGSWWSWTGTMDWAIGLEVHSSPASLSQGPKKNRRHKKNTHTLILQGCFFLKAVDFSVASKKKGQPHFPTSSVFSSCRTRTFHFQPPTFCFELLSFFLNWSVFFLTLAIFSNLTEWQTEAFVSNFLMSPNRRPKKPESKT